MQTTEGYQNYVYPICRDIDACIDHPCGEHICEDKAGLPNSPEGRECVCKDGYEINDIGECECKKLIWILNLNICEIGRIAKNYEKLKF